MFADEKPDPRSRNLHEDVSREDIVSAFRVAMIGHFRSHIPGTNINESTLLASDYLNHRSEERRVGKECRSRWSPYH